MLTTMTIIVFFLCLLVRKNLGSLVRILDEGSSK